MNELYVWLAIRIRWFYNFPVKTLGLPSWYGYLLVTIVVLLFLVAIYDLLKYRDRGYAAILWLAVVVLVPLGSLIYLLIGSRMIRKTPVYVSPKPVAGSGASTKRVVKGKPTSPVNPKVVYGGLILIAVLAGMLFIVTSSGLQTTDYASASHYENIAGMIMWPFAILCGCWLSYKIAHPKNLEPRTSPTRFFLVLIGFIAGFVPGIILAFILTYPLSKHACQLSGSKYC